MPADETRLVVRIEAQLRQFERQMAKANGTAERSARRIERRFQAMDSRLGLIGRGLARSLLGPLAAFASAREIGQAADAFTRIENALKVVGLEGDAAAAVFDRLFAAAQKNAAPVESLVQLYGRAALVQKELGVSTEELLGFTEGVAAALRVSGKSAQEASGALLQLSQALGSGVVRAEEFNSLLEGALPIAQATALGLEEAGGSVAKLRTLIIEGKVSSEAFFRAFRVGQPIIEEMAETAEFTLGQAMTRVNNSFIKAVGAINDTTNAGPALVAALNAVADAFEALPDLVDNFRTSLDDLANSDGWLGWLLVSQREAEEFKQSILEMQGAVDETRGDAIDALREKLIKLKLTGAETAEAMESDIAQRVDQAFADVLGRRVSIKDAPVDEDSDKKKGKTPEQKFDDDIRRIRDRTDALKLESLVINENTQAREHLLAVQGLINEAQQAGLAITPERLRLIEEEAAAYAKASEALELAAEKQDRLNELASFTGDTLLQAFRDLVPAVETGNKALDGLIQRLQQAVLQAAIFGEGPFGSFLGGNPATGGKLGGLIGRIFGGFRAEGGPVSPGRAYVVGERGREMFVPSVAGVVRPMGGGGDGDMRVHVSLSGANGDAAIAEAARRAAFAGAQMAVRESRKSLPNWMNDVQGRDF
jgi:tape measure domain-containing protein